jgi:hypothetical protein
MRRRAGRTEDAGQVDVDLGAPVRERLLLRRDDLREAALLTSTSTRP